MAYGTPGIHTHEQWLGLVQPVGLVVAPTVLNKLELFPNQGTAYLSALQRQLEALLEERDTAAGEPIQVVPGFGQLATELLDWGETDLLNAHQLQTIPEVVLSEYGETLRPTHGVPSLEGEGLQALVLDLTALGEWGRAFDQPWNPSGNGWDATPQQRFERLLKESEHPIGILFNGTDLRLVHSPRGESSGWLTMPLEPMAEVAGRPMLGALELLLGVDRLFGGNPEQRLPALLAASRKNQSEVSTRLAEQVLEALWELLLGFDEAERLAQESGRTVLGDLPHSEAGQKQLYGGLITVLLRLVFLLYAEDEALMPADSLYGQHYSVSALADRLRQERVEHQGAMSDRRGAWASLLSLFRLVYDGGGADPNYLPARHGELFDPDAYPFLEGRDSASGYQDAILSNLPSISDDVVEKVLTRLLWLADENKVAQRLNYRSLDVEQIGSVYEGIMGFRVEQAQGPSVGVTYRPPRQKISITVVVNAEELLAQSAGKREKWLDEQAGVKLKLPAKVKRELKSATSLAELCLALDKKLSPHTPRGLQPGSLILQPTAERRRSGSHYTPRALTEPIVAEAFRPWLERCNHQPTAEQILDLKVCDPAMGSGAFLVAVCRFLAGWLVQAWERDGFPEGFRQDADKDTVARRLVAQRCLYGVDKNPFAVNLARLSLWLVTLSKDLPFTFVDHALKCGDSLVGYSVKEIRAAMSEVQLGFLDVQNRIYEQMGIDRRETFAFDSLSDADYDSKKLRLEEQIKATEGLRQAGDLMVAAFFAKTKPKERADKQEVYLAMLIGAFNDEGLQDSIDETRKLLASGEKGISPFHWDLEFPEVFRSEKRGFDAFVGNPPFLGGKRISTEFGEPYNNWLVERIEGASKNADLVAHFFRQQWLRLMSEGTLSLIATNTVAQGDTRVACLGAISRTGGTIYNATKRLRWPGEASVLVSMVHIIKHCYKGSKYLNKRKVKAITPFLLDSDTQEEPRVLESNSGLSFIGPYPLGKGFLFHDSEHSSLDTPDTPTPLAVLSSLVESEPGITKYVKPYTGGDEVMTDPAQKSNRFVIDLGEMSFEECEAKAPLLIELLRVKVLPIRSRKDPVKYPRMVNEWWKFWNPRVELTKAIQQRALEKIIFIPNLSIYPACALIPSQTVVGTPHNVIASSDLCLAGILQSQVHNIWISLMSSSLGDGGGVRYTPTDCFETFPFPCAFDKHTGNSLADESLKSIAAKEYFVSRDLYLMQNKIGITGYMGRINNPAISDSGMCKCRDMVRLLDDFVITMYEWNDIHLGYGFGLDYVDLEDGILLPDELQERIDTGELFFWDAGDALDFQGQLEAYGAISGRRKLPWRYRWPDAVRDDVLARLLALNAERYQEEVDQGLHGGRRGRGGGSSGGSGTGRRRGRPPKNTPPGSGQSSQFDLGL